MTPDAKTPTIKPAPLIVLLGWLVPGLGLVLVSQRAPRRRRALAVAVLLHATFFIGVAMRGGVVLPIVDGTQIAFSVLNVLTFALQTAAGWPALLSLAASLGECPVVGADPAGAYHELGALFCMTAGALNYFAVRQALDRNQRKRYELLARE